MEPLSIAASVIAVCQAGDRVGGLLSRIRLWVDAPKDVNELSIELSNIRKALEGLLSSSSVACRGSNQRLQQAISACLMRVGQLDQLLLTSLVKWTEYEGKPLSAANRMGWVRKKSKVKKIQASLKHDIAAIQLEVLSLSLTGHYKLLTSVEQLGESIQGLQESLVPPSQALKITGRETGNLASGICAQMPLRIQRVLPPDNESFIAIRQGNLGHLKALFLQRLASVDDIVAPYGLSVLSLAAFYGQSEICQFLLSVGASQVNPLEAISGRHDVLSFWGSYSTLEYTITAADIFRDHILQTSSGCHAEALSQVTGATCLEVSSFNRLHKSVLGLTSESLEDLLPPLQMEIDETDSLGRTPLHLAAYRLNVSDIKTLLSHNAQVNLADFTEKTPLQIAATLNSLPTARALLAGGAAIGHKDQYQNTVLHNVCVHGFVAVAELLLNSGADMEAQNSLGETPLRHAVLGNHLEVVELLHERGAAFIPQDRIGCTTLSDAVQFNAHAVLPFLLGLRMRVDLIYFSGKTVLHILAENSDVYTMQIFLDLAETGVGKLDVDHVDHKGYTAMEYIHLRSDADEVLEAFKRIIARIQIEKQGTAMLCSKDQDADDDGDFEDAVEVQESCA